MLSPKFLSWVLPGTLLIITAGLQGFELSLVLRYERSLIAQGELWRLLSGQFMHLGWSHWLLNNIGLLLLWGLFGSQQTTKQWLLHIGVCIAVVAIGLYVFSPAVSWYVGMSGFLHGLFVAGLLADKQLPRPIVWLTLLGFAAKLFWEQWQGPLPGSEASSGGNVVVDAHLYGAIGGLLSTLGLWLWARLQAKAED